MKHIVFIALIAISMLTACKNGNGNADASGTFEANEVIVSAESSGKLTSFTV